MKIAFINIYQGLVDRGAETFVSELSKRLREKHEVVVFSGKRLPPKRWPFLWRFFIDPQGLYIGLFTLIILPKIFKGKFDAVIPLNGGWQPALIRILTWLCGKKIIISGQSGIGWDEANNLWCFPDTFVALSRYARDWAKSVNPIVKRVYIPNGVDTKAFAPQGPRLKIDLPKPVVLCVGALTKSKRIDLTIRAVAKLGVASLLVVGDGELRHDIKSLGENLLGKRFSLIKVPFKEMPKVYRACDIFTIASEPFHAFEIVLLEAMATGLPVVANKDEIRKEIVSRAGVLVNSENIDAYSIALKAALRLKWGKRPIIQAKKFDWDKIAQKYEKLIVKFITDLKKTPPFQGGDELSSDMSSSFKGNHALQSGEDVIKVSQKS